LLDGTDLALLEKAIISGSAENPNHLLWPWPKGLEIGE
jgi:hypothetical protein